MTPRTLTVEEQERMVAWLSGVTTPLETIRERVENGTATTGDRSKLLGYLVAEKRKELPRIIARRKAIVQAVEESRKR